MSANLSIINTLPNCVTDIYIKLKSITVQPVYNGHFWDH